MTKPLCIYHGGCDDGFAAAWCVRAALGSEVEFYPGVYQKEPPPHDGRDVIFVDFSYKRPVFDAMADKANSILILDHHKTAAEDLADLRKPPPASIWLAASLDGTLSRDLRTAVLGAPISVSDLFSSSADSDRIDHHMFAWPLTDIKPFDAPQFARGMQGFWTWSSVIR